MSIEESIVSSWITRFKDGDQTAIEQLWRLYRSRVVRFARRRLKGGRRSAADEEDVAQNAWVSFWRCAIEGRCSRLYDQESLWRLLRVIVKRTAINQLRHERRQKRGCGMVRSESQLPAGADSAKATVGDVLDTLPGAHATPETIVAGREMTRRFLDRLKDSDLHRIAIMKMQAYTDQEIADLISCARSTVVRKLGLIRKIWLSEIEP